LTMITRGEYTPQILGFLKLLLITLSFPLKSATLQNIKDIMLYLMAKEQKHDDQGDIQSIVAYINTRKQCHSNLLESFSTNI
jgi:hypothetical protein